MAMAKQKHVTQYEANKPEIEYIRARYNTMEIVRARQRLCTQCWRESDCELLPITTLGADCPYSETTGGSNDDSIR